MYRKTKELLEKASQPYPIPHSGRGKRSRRVEESRTVSDVEYWPIFWLLLMGLALFSPRGPVPGMAAFAGAAGAAVLGSSRRLGPVRWAASFLFVGVFALAMWRLWKG